MSELHEFDFEINLRVRVTVDETKVEQVCRRYVSELDPLDAKEWIASDLGVEFQKAVLRAFLSTPRARDAILLSRMHFDALNSLENRFIDEQEICREVAQMLPPAHRETLHWLLETENDTPANLPVLFDESGTGADRCIKMDNAVSVRTFITPERE